MLKAICALRPLGISDYLQMIEVSWEKFERESFAPTPAPAPAPAPTPTPVKRGAIGTIPGGDEWTIQTEPELHAQREAYFQQVFQEFSKRKVENDEGIESLSFGKFAEVLRANTADLMKRPGVIDVRFSIYVKDGKVALKASVIRR
jgi:hypothetical protein